MRITSFGRSVFAVVLILALMGVIVSGCRPLRPLRPARGPEPPQPPPARTPYVKPEVELVEVASSERLWTGVAVSKKGRIFVNYPRWSDDVTFSVGEINATGGAVPFPDEEWNTWDGSTASADRFV